MYSKIGTGCFLQFSRMITFYITIIFSKTLGDGYRLVEQIQRLAVRSAIESKEKSLTLNLIEIHY